MIWHPLTWAFWAAIFTGSLIYGLGVLRALNVLADWAPDRTDASQLRRERDAEIAALLAHGSLACLAAAAALGLIGIALVWHQVVPGAMCGTGVMQALGTHGSRAFIFWGLALSILYAWRVTDRLNRHHPQGLLTPSAARMLVTAAPFLGLAVFYSWQALMRVESIPPVSCCAAVYDQVFNQAADIPADGWLVTIFFWGHLIGGAALLTLAILKKKNPLRGSGIIIASIAVLWCCGAAVATKQVWSAYYYQVLSHPCPWCLFLPDHYGAGFLIFGCMAVIAMEAIALWSAEHIHRRHPLLIEAAIQRIRRSAWYIICALIGYTILTAGPAIHWLLHSGVRMNDPF